MKNILKLLFATITLMAIVVSCTKEPSQQTVAVNGVTISSESINLEIGDQRVLMATVSPSNATNKNVTFSSSEESVATVSQNGIVYAIAAGKSIVTVTTEDGNFKASCSIEVAGNVGAVTGIATHISCRNAEISGKANLPGTTSADLSFGVLYSTSSEVLVGSATQINALSFDSEYNYSVNTEVLEPETTYYYRSYVSKNWVTTYGEVKSFKTLAVNSMIQTLDVTDINQTDAVLNASLDLTDCKYDRLEYGFEVTPEGGSAHTVKSSNRSENKFSVKDETLSRETKYSVAAYVKLNGRTYKGEANVFTTLGYQTPDLVDLGLSVKWATFNLGASKPEEYGGYYQWAGLEDVTSTSIYLDWSNCPYHTGSSRDTGWTKYIPSDKSSYWSGSGSPDNKTVLDPEDDVAHVTLGGSWRMPTRAEWTELIDNCIWTWTSDYNGTGIAGSIVTSKISGYTDKSIFLPAAGYRKNDSLIDIGSSGYYWSSTHNIIDPYYAGYLHFISSDVNTIGGHRLNGRAVRPVSE